MEEKDTPDFPMDAKPWAQMLKDAEKADEAYQARCDRIDRLYACLGRDDDAIGDRELQVFWANMQVLAPTIYSRPPVPVAAPRFRDRKPLLRRASELLERALITDAETDAIHDTLILARDDLARLARGVVWVRLVQDEAGGRCVLEHIMRKDFRHGKARKWQEVPWVARAGYLTREEYKARFGEIGEGVSFRDRSKDKGDDQEEVDDQKAKVWEIWHRSKRKVVWLAEGAAKLSDAKEPLYKLDGFWPCPRPVYATIKPGSLTPIPDAVYYQDQLDEINELTDRIAGLTEALRVKGFYATGNGDIGSTIERTMADTDNRAVMVPVTSTQQLGGPSMADSVVWMPIDQIATTIQAAVELRRQLMQDVYEITGLSDIMRGASEAQETLGAQQLKAQFGSVRVKERQGEMQRLARDVFRIKAEIMAEQFPAETLMEMAQIDDLPTAAEIEKQKQAVMQPAQQQVQQIKVQTEQQIMLIVQQASQPQQPQPAPQQPMAAPNAA